MIEVQSISKFYGNKQAVSDLSFKIREGEIIGLLGLNGAGKSTILKMLGCFLVPSQGDALVAGHSVTEDPDAVRKLIGFLPDNPPLYDEMKVQDYLTFVARLKNVPKDKVNSHVNDAIMKTNLEEVASIRLGELSHGFQQRVGIAQAIVHRPKILILDEPINGLDPIQIVEMRDLILSLKKEHTVILSSHILSEITKTCDRILVIDRGCLVAEGTEAELRGTAAQAIVVRVEILDDLKAWQDQVKNIKGVQAIVAVPSQRTSFYDITCEYDARVEISKCIVQTGAGLLGLGRREDELETLFMKLVKGGE